MSRESKDVKKKKKASKTGPQDLRAEVSGLKKRRRLQTRTPTPPSSTSATALSHKKEPQDLRAETKRLKKGRRLERPERLQTRTPTPSTETTALRDQDDLSRSKDVSKKKKGIKIDVQDRRTEAQRAELRRTESQDRRTEVKGVEPRKKSEKVGVVQTHSPTTPSSMTSPKQRDQGDLTLRHKTKKMAERLRMKRRRKGRKRQ